MSQGLSVNRLIKVTTNLTPLAAQFANFNTLMMVGSSNVINVSERYRSFNSLEEVADTFGTSAPEYTAAALFFGQIPQPSQLFIGRWAKTATSGLLVGGVLTAEEQTLATWTAITNGGVNFTIDGTARNLTGLNFSSALNMNGVASVINTALGVNGSCTWDGEKFTVTSATTGTSSTVAYATAGAGTNIATMLKLTSALASPPVAGIAAETPLQAVTILDDKTYFYALTFADTTVTDDQHVAVAGYLQGTTRKHVYGVSITNTNVLSSGVTNDLASRLRDLGYTRTFDQYAEIPYVASSFLGRALTVNFAANNSTITMMYKQEPGVAPLLLTATQADTLQAKRANFFVQYDNNTAILQNGVMAGPAFFDEIYGLDWLENQIQTNVYNLLYTSPTKVPQTDAGTQLIVNAVAAACAAGVNNGLIAPGRWNSAGFGTLAQGDFMPTGYYIYAPPVALQAQADREARKSVPIQVAVKLAGAIHTVDVLVNVNR